MALDVFGGVFTAQQIVKLALVRAGSPNRHLDEDRKETLAAVAYLELQALLDSLATDYDWPFSRVIRYLTVSGRSTPLPNEFARISHDDPAWILDGCGGRTRIHLDDEPAFFDSISAPPVQTGTPVRMWIHKEPALLYLEPPPGRSMELELHFQPWHIPLAEIDSKPWFPWSEYLIEALGAKLALGEDDQRAASCDAVATRLMKRIRRSETMQGDRTFAVRLNPTVYRKPRRI